MNTVSKNLDTWTTFDWEGTGRGGDRWSGGYGSVAAQWHFCLLPRVQRFLPAASICEIAPGYGRWTSYLVPQCEQFIGVDLTQRCVEACQSRFANYSHARFAVNDGYHLTDVADSSVDFVFSMDSLVHCQFDVVASYVAEALRVLREDGVAFFHHSNVGGVPGATDGTTKIHWRATNVSAAGVAKSIQDAGGAAYSQELVNWADNPNLIDCYTIFGRQQRDDLPFKRVENPHHSQEASFIRVIQELYCR